VGSGTYLKANDTVKGCRLVGRRSGSNECLGKYFSDVGCKRIVGYYEYSGMRWKDEIVANVIQIEVLYVHAYSVYHTNSLWRVA